MRANNSYLVAAAMARPIVTTDAPGCRDTIIDGETGFLCRTADANDLAEKLLRFAALSLKEREAMGRRGREFVVENFDERFVLRRYSEVVRSMVKYPQCAPC
jgi:glycosyltransferase involved in cell wall biosynthesis